MERRTGEIRRTFSRMHRALDGWMLFTNKERSSSKRRMEGGIADETSLPPFKCECFGSAT